MFGVDVRIVFVSLAGWVVLDVQKLTVVVIRVLNAMLVVSAVPDFCCGLLAGCEGGASFDVLNAFCC
jgi:hypothetical protein